MSEHPPVPFPAAPGHVWTLRVDDDWSTDPAALGGRQCVQRVASERCPNDAVAVLYRTVWMPNYRTTRPYRYCADHLYGRWLHDGKVVGWRMVPA